MREILSETVGQLLSGKPFVLVGIVTEHGSTPRAAGTQMLVRGDGSTAGTIGGGLLEATMIRGAEEALKSGRSRVGTVALEGRSVADASMLCGGRAEMLLAYVPGGDAHLLEALRALEKAQDEGRPAWLYTFFRLAPDTVDVSDVAYAVLGEDEALAGDLPCAPELLRGLSGKLAAHGVAELPDGRSVAVETILPPNILVICGAGHVAVALAPAAAAVGFEVVVVDDRPDFATPERFPSATRVHPIDSFERAFDDVGLGPRSYVVVVTRGHEHDYTVVEQALRSDARYIGLMGSKAKRGKIMKGLTEAGFSTIDLERLHTPIGIAIGAEAPAELAVSITAELILVRAETAR